MLEVFFRDLRDKETFAVAESIMIISQQHNIAGRLRTLRSKAPGF